MLATFKNMVYDSIIAESIYAYAYAHGHPYSIFSGDGIYS